MVKTSAIRKSKSKAVPPAIEQRDPNLHLWVTHREESVYFQREAQVNFWTVLGGLAMAALLTQLSPLLREIQASRWYLVLFFLTSILVIAISWVQTAWGSLVLKWPISIATTVFMLFQMIFQSIQCLLVTNPAGWLAATAMIILFSLFNQFYYERSGAWQVFSAVNIKRFKKNNLVYTFFMLICAGGSFLLFRFPSHGAEMVWGFIVLIFSIQALYMQHKGMQQEKKELGIP